MQPSTHLHCAFSLISLSLVSYPRAALEPSQEDVQREALEVVRVVDGDTLVVRRAGRVEKLRLLSVDTEERISGGHRAYPAKPQTVFGEQCALWATHFFADLGQQGDLARVRLCFPGADERRDRYGRLLCHVILPDGRNYNLLLVQLGKSPYFNKYGNSPGLHREFLQAQREARRKQLGIWDPRTNRAATRGAPQALRPYDRLRAWWDARSISVEGYRKRRSEPAPPLALESSKDLEQLRPEAETEVFGTIRKLEETPSGDQLVFFHGPRSRVAFRARIPRAVRSAHVGLDLQSTLLPFRQNYLYLSGRTRGSEEAVEILSLHPEQWRRAGPEPRRP